MVLVLLVPLVSSAQSTLPMMGVGKTTAGGVGGCLLLEGGTDQLLLEGTSDCIALE